MHMLQSDYKFLFMVLVKHTAELNNKIFCSILEIKLKRDIDFVLSKHGCLGPTIIIVVTRNSLSPARDVLSKISTGSFFASL